MSPTFWQFGIGLMLVLAVLFARRGLLGLAEDAGAISPGEARRDRRADVKGLIAASARST